MNRQESEHDRNLRQVRYRAQQLSYCKFALYRDLFPGFAKSLHEAGCGDLQPLLKSDSEVAWDIWSQADREWCRFTLTPPIRSETDWAELARLVGISALNDLFVVKEAILRWAIERQRPFLNQDSLASNGPITFI